jgi:O-antigen biosynthesis protein WbqP
MKPSMVADALGASAPPAAGFYARFLKRAVDLGLGLAALLVLSPLLIVAALAIRLEDGGPIFFRQVRNGRGGKTFRIFKFRSMRVDAPELPSALARAMPVTRVGHIIRRTNVDELPQLLNIVKGDMSIVGPRPPIPAQEALLEMRRANGSIWCRPGLTGLAQIRGYDGMPEEEKAECDGAYAARISALGDLVIVLKTFGYLLKRPPVY